MAREHTNQHTIMFPAPLDVWVVFYNMNIVTLVGRLTFPSPIEGWVGSYYENIRDCRTNGSKFPSTLEVWVGSYIYDGKRDLLTDRKFPSPLEASVVSYMNLKFDVLIRDNVSDPSRGLGSFLLNTEFKKI